MATSLSITNISAILKKVIHPVVENQLRKESVLFGHVKKNVGVTVSNDTIYIAARSGRHSGIYTVAEGTEPRSGKAKYQQPSTTVKFMFGTLELTDQALEAAAKGDVKAIAAILSTEIMAIKDDLKMDANRQMHGIGTGRLCLANGAGTNSTTLTVDGNVAGLDGTEYLVEGMFISIGSGQAVEISSVDSATQVTLANARTWADDAVVTKADAAETMGLAGLIDDGDNVSTIQSIARASNTWANSWTDDTSAVLTVKQIQDIYLKTLRLGGAKIIFMGETLYSKYADLLQSVRKTVDLKEVLSGGFYGLEFAGGNGKVGILLDVDTWDGYVQLVNLDALTIAEMTSAWQWLEADAHGGILKRSSGNRTVWEGTLKYYYNLVSLNFKSHGRLRAKTAS